MINDASLVMIPSGYKDGKLYSVKPTDGSGDFTFSRGSNLAATRVNSEGLIEKGRENIALHSDWDDVGTGTPPTGWGTYDPNFQAGAETGQIRFILSGNRGYIYQNISIGVGVYAFSFYCDSVITACTLSSVVVVFGSATKTTIGIFKDGVKAQFSDLIQAESRYTFVFNVTGAGTGNFRVGAGVNSSDTADITLSRPQIEYGLAATDYIETGASTAQAGILEDMPRLNYGTCPSLLLEPQRTNLVTHSEYTDGTNWSNEGGIIDEENTNETLSPEGVYNAVKLVSANATSEQWIQANGISVTSGNDCTISCFVKKSDYDYFHIRFTGIGGAFSAGSIWFNIANGTLGTTQSGITGTIKDYGNGWYRISATKAVNATAAAGVRFQLASSDNNTSVVGDGSKGTYIYGCQAELGSYPTSYIPTYGASVTRGADDAVATHTLTDTETLTYYTEFIAPEQASGGGEHLLENSSGSSRIRIYQNNSTSIRIRTDSPSSNFDYSYSSLGIDVGDTVKIALSVDSGVMTAFINGVKKNTFGSATINFARLHLRPVTIINTSTEILFDSALSDDQCIALTS